MQRNGFTLVELAIVLMIIGLLIGGVLRGQELLNNAKVSATIQQVNSYSGALNTFMDAYSNLPGDMVQATARIPGCTAGNSCANGNGDGIIGTLAQVWDGTQYGIGTENTQFWKQLALAHLITGVDPSTNVTIWGKSHPAGKLGGGYTVVAPSTGGASQQMLGGLALRLHACLTCGNAEDSGSGTGTGSPASPKQAWQIDSKMDDGNPKTGNVQASAYGNGAQSYDCEEVYNTARDDGLCTMAFMMRR